MRISITSNLQGVIAMNAKNLNTLSKNIQTMSSREIAKLTGKRHDNVMSDIRIMFESLNIQSPEFLGDYKDSKGRTYSQFNLPKRETLILVSGYNVALRAKIIDRWIELEEKDFNSKVFIATRQDSKTEYKAMGLAIKEAHEEIKPYHFSNEADLINRIALGMTASKFRKYHEIEKGELIRDYMTTIQLECIVSLQRANTVYIEDGLSFELRKSKLTDLFNRKHKQKLIDEVHLLNA